MAEEQLRRLGGGRWQTKDERFTIEPQSGTWVVVDAQQHDDLGLPLVRGPFGSLADARLAIAGAREEPVPASPLAEREPRRSAVPVKADAKAGPRLGTLPYAPSKTGPGAKRPTEKAPTEKAPTAAEEAKEAKEAKGATEQAPTLAKEAKAPTGAPTRPNGVPAATATVARGDREPELPGGPHAGGLPSAAPAQVQAAGPVGKPGPTTGRASKPSPAPWAPPAPSGDPAWLTALPSAQRPGARALIKQLAGAGFDDPSAIARAELEDDAPAIARAVLERRLRSLLEGERDPDRLARAILALVSAGEDADLDVRWRLVDGDGRPLVRADRG